MPVDMTPMQAERSAMFVACARWSRRQVDADKLSFLLINNPVG